MLQYKSSSAVELNPIEPINYRNYQAQNDFFLSNYKNREIINRNKVDAKKTILMLNCDERVGFVYECLGQSRKYEVLNTPDATLTSGIMESISPHLVVLGIEKLNEENLEQIRKLKSNPVTAGVPLVIFSKEKPSLEDTDTMFAAGVIDCLNASLDNDEIIVRLKSTLLQVHNLTVLRERERLMEGEREKLFRHFENLKGEIDTKHRESVAHLELLIRSKEVNETLIDKIHDLRPFLNPQGRSKLNFIAKQMKWELDEESELNLQRRLDESNHKLYLALEKQNVGLTKYEMRLCAYLLTNHSSASIARITRKSSNCINVAFARIRMKLAIRDNNALKAFLKTL